MNNLFDGIKVLDFTNSLAGPIASALMADYGAHVIHVEKPTAGDDNRLYPPLMGGVYQTVLSTPLQIAVSSL